MNRRKAPVWIEEKPKQKPPQLKKYIPRMMKHAMGSDVICEDTKWIWYPYIPKGKLTIIEGDPGIGKSWITLALARSISGGEALPGMEGRPHIAQKVVLASAEDGIADTVVPRLKLLGANLENIVLIDENFILDEHGVDDLEYMLGEYAAGIVFIDPLVAYLGGKMDMNKANEVREVMTRLGACAERSGAAIIAVRHLRKAGAGSKGKEIYAGLGSIDFTAAARSVLAVTQAKDGTKLLRHIKSNLTPKGRALSYELDTQQGDAGADWTSGMPFKWTGYYSEPESENKASGNEVCTTRKKDACATFMFDLLRDGDMPASDAKEACLKAGYKMGTIKKAKIGLVESKKLGTGTWVWYLIEREGMDNEKTQPHSKSAETSEPAAAEDTVVEAVHTKSEA